MLDFGDDFGDSFSYDKDLVQKTKKPYEVEFKVLSPADIDRDQNSQITEVSSILGLPPESAGILLRFARWNREKLIESYMDSVEYSKGGRRVKLMKKNQNRGRESA